MASHAQIEASQPVTRKRITTALQDYRSRLVVFHDPADGGLEDALVTIVVDAISEREVDRVVLSLADTNISQFASSGEVLAVLVEGDGHDSVGRVKGLLDAITVVDVNVDIEDAFVEAEEFEDAEDDV